MSQIDRETYDRLLDVTGGDLQFLDELVETYLSDADEQLDAMRSAAAIDDAAALLRPAHTLKSSSANVGALGLADQCRSLEADARAGAVPDMASRVAACASAFEAVRTELLELRIDR
jgi:HPt (histidine-containing phosphotransfer) domain-containing protein